jgi:Fe-S-cluster containining protein
MVLEERIRKWQQNVLNDYCKVCSDTCCNGQKHKIMVDLFSLPLFKEKGIPVVKNREVDKFSFKNNKLYFKNGSLIQKPALVQMPRWLFGDEWYLYSDFCPFYKDNQCEVHEDSRRPEVCKQYPIVFLGCNDPKGKKLDIKIMKSCEYFNNEKIRYLLTEKFPVRIID